MVSSREEVEAVKKVQSRGNGAIVLRSPCARAMAVFTAISMIGCTNCEVSDCNFEDVDVGVNLTDTVGAKISNMRVTGGVAVKGVRVKRLRAENVRHIFIPSPSTLAITIRRINNGYV